MGERTGEEGERVREGKMVRSLEREILTIIRDNMLE